MWRDRRPQAMSRLRWALGAFWRKLQWKLGVHWKQRGGVLTWERFTRLVRARMMFDKARWDTHLRQEPCVYCGRTLGFDKMTIEHVIPRSRGGIDSSRNKVGCCGPCNRNRGAKPLLHFLLQRQGIDVSRALQNHRYARQQAARSVRGQLLPHGPKVVPLKKAKPLTATLEENLNWKSAFITAADLKNRKDTDVDLRRKRG